MTNPLEGLNLSLVSEITAEQFTALANKFVAIPSLIIFFLFTILIFLFIGLIFVKKSRGKFMTIWVISTFLSLLVLLFLVFLPNVVIKSVEFSKSLLS